MAANLSRLGFSPYATAWGLGSYDNPDVAFNGRDGNGVMWVLEKVKGWKATTPDLPVVRGAGDGGWFGTGTRQPKTMTLSGAFRCNHPDLLRAAEQQLRAAIEHLDSDQILWVDGAVPKQMSVRLSGAFDVDEPNSWTRTWSAVVTAADPVKYAAGSSGLVTLTFTLPQQTSGGGLSWPIGFPLGLYGAVNPAYQSTVNPGDLPVFPTVEFDGPVISPTLEHLTSSAFFGVSGQLVDGTAATSNFRYSNLLVDGASARSRRAAGSSYFQIASGRNDLHLAVDPVLNPSTSLSPHTRAVLSYRPAWR